MDAQQTAEQQMPGSEIVKELEEIEALFVRTAYAVERADGRLVLRGVAPSTLYFSDRPQRDDGHIGTPAFVAIWDEGENSFAADPPNAVDRDLRPSLGRRHEPRRAAARSVVSRLERMRLERSFSSHESSDRAQSRWRLEHARSIVS